MTPNTPDNPSPRTLPLLALSLLIALPAPAQNPESERSDANRKLKADSLSAPPNATSAPYAVSFWDAYCLSCHDLDTEKGEREFETLAFPLEDELAVISVQEIIDQLTLEEMPPRKAKSQPDAAERAAAIEAFTQTVADARDRLASTGGRTVLRRLNQREYVNTLRDLTGLPIETFDPTTKMPRDQETEHLDNIGDTLVTSGYLLDQYLEAADLVIEKAAGPDKKPAVQSWHFEDNFYQGQELDYAHKRVYNYKYLCVYEVPRTPNHEGGYAQIQEFKEGVPHDGWYEIKVQAHAMHRDTPYDRDIFKTDFAEPFRLGIVPGDHKIGELHHPQPIEPRLAEVTVHDGDTPREYKMKVWLEAGQTPRFIFPNGMANCRSAMGQVARKYKDQWPKNDPYTGGIVEARRIVLAHGRMPHIRIHEVDIRGPLYESWPTPSQKHLYGEKGFSPKRTRPILTAFAAKAYRRPAEKHEIDRLMKIVAQRKQAGRTPRQATNDALKAILCSPSFLYLQPLASSASESRQPTAESRQPAINPHALATRLSYFLWSTMPDTELRQKADDGTILQPAVLNDQLDRMLKNPRSEEFINGFADAWLNLRYLGEMPPDRSLFPTYYAHDLENAFKEETRHFLRHLLARNGPVTDLLDSDYTFLNKALAKHYDLDEALIAETFDQEPATAHLFQKVSLEDTPARGGLLGMASIHTVTANGIETSPVVRGVWLLENILGTPPPPPPDDVPAIDPDTRGALTIRDQLAKHREIESCNNCHRKTDPPGWALENFDPVGQWRNDYPSPGKGMKPHKIDASSEFATGEPFEDIVEFKTLIQKPNRLPLFKRALTEKLLEYATGRRMEPLDYPEAMKIAHRNEGFRDLVKAVVQSDQFQSR